MAYSFGGGVRPELGRTDFTPFLQGSAQGAQMQARGAENFAAGVSQFLQKAGEGVKAYQENKAINTMFNSTVDDAIKINEEGGGELARMLKIADPSDRGAWAAGIKSLGEGDKKKGSMAVRTFMMEMAQQEAERERMQGVIDPSLSPEENVQRAIAAGASVGEASALGNFLTNAQQARNPPPPKLDQFGQMVQDEVNAFEATNGRPPTPQELVVINQRVKEIGRSSTVINLADQTEDRETATARVTRNREMLERAEAGIGSMRQTIQLKELLESGDVNTGIFAPIKQGIDRFVGTLGGEEAARKASATEKAKSFMASEVFQYIQQLGLGSRNFDTPAERAVIEAASTGDITMTRRALLDLAKKRYDEARRNVEKYNTRVAESEGYRDWVRGFNYDVPTYEVPEWGGASKSFQPTETVNGVEWVQDSEGNWSPKR